MKKISYLLLICSSLAYSQGMTSGLFFSQQGESSGNSKKVTITFDAPPTKVNVKKRFTNITKSLHLVLTWTMA
jgi:uncharacterized protein YegJ (DUF2314 family)